MAILDQYGKPIHIAELKEPQTAKAALLHREFANHPSRGLTPAKLAGILQAAEQGELTAQHELFLDMEEKDAHLYAELHKRKMAVAGLDWSIEPPRNPSAREKKQAAALEEMIRDLPDLEDVVFDLADGIGHGFACLELEWQQLGGAWLPKSITHRPQSWFTVDQATRTELRLRSPGRFDGVALQPFGWIMHIHRARSGYLARGGLHRVLAWPFLFKNYSVRDLAEFLEVYGLPVGLGKYQPGASDQEKATLLKALLAIGHSARGIIPDGMAIEFLQAAQGQSDPFVVMIQWCESSVSKAILGGTLTSQTAANGNRALGEVHNEVRCEIRDHDARQIGSTLTRDLVYPLAVLNTQGVEDPRRCPRFVFDTGEAEDLALYADSLPKLVDYGARVPVRWVHEKLRIPEPEGEEAVMAAKSSAPAPPAPPGDVPGTAAASTGQVCPHCTGALKAGDIKAAPVSGASDYPDQDAIDRALSALTGATLQGQMEALLKPMLELAETAPDQLLGRLAEVYPEMDDAALTQQMAQLIFVGKTWGRLNGGR